MSAILLCLYYLGGAVSLYAVLLGKDYLLLAGLALILAVVWYPWIKALEAGKMRRVRAYEHFAVPASLVLVSVFAAVFLVLHPLALHVAAPPQPTPCPTVCPTP